MHNYEDFIEFTYRHRHEHACRGFEWYDFLEKAELYGESLTETQLIPWKYPSDKEISRLGVREFIFQIILIGIQTNTLN